MDKCLFCDIIDGKIASQKHSETALVYAFYDIHPQAPLHILLIPKEHIHSILEVKENHASVLSEMVQLAQAIAKKEAVDKTGFRLVFNCGPNAGQAVDHLHLHLLAKRKLAWPPG